MQSLLRFLLLLFRLRKQAKIVPSLQKVIVLRQRSRPVSLTCIFLYKIQSTLCTLASIRTSVIIISSVMSNMAFTKQLSHQNLVINYIHHYVITENLLEWLKHFLSNRQQSSNVLCPFVYICGAHTTQA